MAVHIRKRENESDMSLIYRFTKRVQQSGVLKEVKRRRFTVRKQSALKMKRSALYRLGKRTEIETARKQGIL